MKRHVASERGVGIFEVLLMMALAAGLAIAAYQLFGPQILAAVETLAEKVTDIVEGIGDIDYD